MSCKTCLKIWPTYIFFCQCVCGIILLIYFGSSIQKSFPTPNHFLSIYFPNHFLHFLTAKQCISINFHFFKMNPKLEMVYEDWVTSFKNLILVGTTFYILVFWHTLMKPCKNSFTWVMSLYPALYAEEAP